MKVTTLGNAAAKAQFLNMYAVAPPKVGKTTYLAASALGALPGQEFGLVSSPAHLHIVAVDGAAVEGLAEFLTVNCGKREEVLSVDVVSLAEDVRKAWDTEESTSYAWHMAMQKAIGDLNRRIRSTPGVHAIILSSLTGASEVYVGALTGAPADGTSKKSGLGMDQDKWNLFSTQMVDLRTSLYKDIAHVFWEGHVTTKTQDKVEKETTLVPGATGKNWGMNVHEIVRLRREMEKYKDTKIDKVFVDTRPALDFLSGGRGFGTLLEPKEYDLAKLALKLGKQVGKMQCPSK
jgi:hypothetical protein